MERWSEQRKGQTIWGTHVWLHSISQEFTICTTDESRMVDTLSCVYMGLICHASVFPILQHTQDLTIILLRSQYLMFHYSRSSPSCKLKLVDYTNQTFEGPSYIKLIQTSIRLCAKREIYKNVILYCCFSRELHLNQNWACLFLCTISKLSTLLWEKNKYPEEANCQRNYKMALRF